VVAAFPEYEAAVADLRQMVAARPVDAWAATVYDAWLYALLPLWLPHGPPFPSYMQSEAWAAKAHQAGFGSYAELKHDTVLYAKQAFAEGDQPLPPMPPRHWVEPDPVAFERLSAAAALLRDGLAARDLSTPEALSLLDRLIGMVDRFARIAADELTGRPISPEDNDWLAGIGSLLEVLWLLSSGADEGSAGAGFPDSPDSWAAIVSDIFSNPAEALEIGTAGFDTLYVLVPADDGRFEVAVGATYAFHEFWVPRDRRLTDEEWRRMLSDGTAPDRPVWLSEALLE
jgi:hypothetical protein